MPGHYVNIGKTNEIRVFIASPLTLQTSVKQDFWHNIMHHAISRTKVNIGGFI